MRFHFATWGGCDVQVSHAARHDLTLNARQKRHKTRRNCTLNRHRRPFPSLALHDANKQTRHASKRLSIDFTLKFNSFTIRDVCRSEISSCFSPRRRTMKTNEIWWITSASRIAFGMTQKALETTTFNGFTIEEFKCSEIKNQFAGLERFFSAV